MNGIATVIANVLRQDTLSGAASTYVANYPTLFSAGASSVPLHLYTCLKDLWGQSEKTNEQWSQYIVDTFGLGLSAGNSIDVTTFRIIDQGDVPKGMTSSNETGAEMAEVHILMKIPDKVSSADSSRLYEAEARIRRLIDYNYRVNTTHTPSIRSTDPTIRSDRMIQCYWQGAVRPDDIKSWAVSYFCSYSRVFLK